MPHLNTPEEIVPLPRDLSSQSDQYKNDFNMSPEAEAARAAKKIEQYRIAADVAARLPAAGDGADAALQFPMDDIDDQGNQGKGGKKRTKTRAVRRKKSYKKSKKSYKKSKKSYKKSKRCGATRKTHPEH